MANATVHTYAVNEISRKLKHTKIAFLPKNTTSHTQPLDDVSWSSSQPCDAQNEK